MPIDRRSFLTSPLVAPLAAGALFSASAAQAGGAAPGEALNAAAAGLVPGLPGDQSAALQALVDSAAGRPIFLPAGVYQVANVALRAGTVLRGAGPATHLQSGQEQPAIRVENVENISLTDLSISAGGQAEAALAATQVAALRIAGCEISGGANALTLENVSGSISGCRIFGAGQTGIFCQNAAGLEIVHNTVEDCANNGIQIWRSAKGDDGTIVAHNRVRKIAAQSGGSGENGNGINIFRAGGVMVSANRIEDCAYSAVRSNAGSNCQILGNSCMGLGEVAIYAEFGFEGALVASNIIDTAATGIAITNFNEGGRLAVCSGNLVRNLKVRDHFDARGTGIGAEADTIITGNVVEGAPTAGLALGYGKYLRNVSATNNVLRDCGVGIAVSVAPGAGTALISANIIAGAQTAAIQGFIRDLAVAGDLAQDAAKRWKHLTINGNVTA